jgi:hypothetical protein
LRETLPSEDLDEVEPGVLWAHTELGFDLGVRHRERMVRSAIVTDTPWMARATKLFAWMIPGEARVFPVGELEQAKPGSQATRRGKNPSSGPGQAAAQRLGARWVPKPRCFPGESRGIGARH